VENFVLTCGKLCSGCGKLCFRCGKGIDKVWITFQNYFFPNFLEDLSRFFKFSPSAKIKKSRPRKRSPKKENPFGKKISLRDLSEKKISKS
jgi:hypothetical protein